jgi:hypothetical protein
MVEVQRMKAAKPLSDFAFSAATKPSKSLPTDNLVSSQRVPRLREVVHLIS